jgi:hypothetical protein
MEQCWGSPRADVEAGIRGRVTFPERSNLGTRFGDLAQIQTRHGGSCKAASPWKLNAIGCEIVWA